MTTEKNKGIALVTGGATGIGAACCRELAASGFRVGIHYRSSDLSARKLQAELPGSFLVKTDLSTEEGVEEVFQILKKEGGVEVLVNNAGMTLDAPLVRAKLDHFDQIVSLNMRGTWYLTKRLSRLMIKQSHGRIINISSVVGSTGNIGQTIYGMTKAAIENLTKTCAQELAHYKILVNAVAPGFIETQMTEAIPQEQKQELLKRVPLGQMGRPEDVAKMVRFLATEGDYCTGNVFHVNGGMYGG